MNIDFVMTWVDDADPAWREEKAKYSPDQASVVDDGNARYRDWGILKYWFRGVERFAPWVHRIYFVTCGHVPEWLNLEDEKLVHIKHSDYMPAEYLPTFSSHPIELNFHRIPDLCEHFVYFNDDMFLTGDVTPETFFSIGQPNYQARIHGILPRATGGIMPHIYMNMMQVINTHFSKNTVLKRDKKKWFSISSNGLKTVIENYFNSRYEQFLGFDSEHLPVALLKSTLEEVWTEEKILMDETSRHKFRDMRDVSQYLFRYWQMCKGEFHPIKPLSMGRKFTVRDNHSDVCEAIAHQKYKMVCVNDMDELSSWEMFEIAKNNIINSFERILPEQSRFEK